MKRQPGFSLVVATLLLTGCDVGDKAAPPTDFERRPEIVGVVRSWDFWQGFEGRYTLSTGDVLELNVSDHKDLPKTPRLSDTTIYFPYGGESYGEPIGRLSVLLLAGHEPDGSLWYAAAQQRDDPACPFEIHGAGVYDESSVLHFSTGLVLVKAQAFDFAIDYRVRQAFPLRSVDVICLNGAGQAVSARLFAAN
jgi:hypothetical protein